MLLNFDDLYYKYKLKIKGILHIGAHFGQEFEIYKKYNITNLIFFEPLPHTFETLKTNIGNKDILGIKPILVNKALGNETRKVDMFCESDNKGQSSSILKPELHEKQYPWIKFNYKLQVDMIKLNDYKFNHMEYNFINIDVQGYEFEVFKGSSEILPNIDYIICEVNRDEVYKDCARVEELDEYLGTFGFKRVETTWDGGTWGDAFYIKDTIK